MVHREHASVADHRAGGMGIARGVRRITLTDKSRGSGQISCRSHQCSMAFRNDQMIKVTAVEPLDDYRLELLFNTGETRVFDVGPYLDKGIFTELRDPTYFRAVRLAFGTVAWPHEQDFGPESLYVES